MKILNIGSLNIDYVYQMDHFIRPGETYPASRLETHCGGKGLNQSCAFAMAGAEIYHAARIGKDGSFLVDKMKEKGVDTRYILPGEGPSGHAIIQVDPEGQNCIILYSGTNYQIDEIFLTETLAHFSSDDVLILQNETNDLPLIMEKASQKGMRIAFNASPYSQEVNQYPLEKVTWILVNEIEGAGLAGTQEKDPDKILESLHEKYPQAGILLTIGKDGSLYVDRKGNVARAHAVPVKAVDTTGAGDTFTGFFLYSLLSGKRAQRALEIASMASAIAVTRPGAADSIPSMREVQETMTEK